MKESNVLSRTPLENPGYGQNIMGHIGHWTVLDSGHTGQSLVILNHNG